MGGGISHQRTINRSAKARIADEVVGTVLKRLSQSAPNPLPSEKPAQGVSRRLFDWLEHPLFTFSVGATSAIIGTFFYAPIFIVCAVCVVLAFHRAKVVSGQRSGIQIASYLAVMSFVALGGYEINSAVQRRAEIDKISFADALYTRVSKLFAKSVVAPATQVPVLAEKPRVPQADPGLSKSTYLGIHKPSETFVLPPNSNAIVSAGPLTPEDKAALNRLDKEAADAKMHLKQDADKLVLHDLFLTDFSSSETTSTNHGGFMLRNGETGNITHIEYAVVRQLETGNKFLSFYLLYTNETQHICESLADKYRVALEDLMEGRVDRQKLPGDSEETSSQDLVFSNRIFIYHETYLSPEQIIAIRDTYKRHGISVVLRSADYLANKKLEAKVEQLKRGFRRP